MAKWITKKRLKIQYPYYCRSIRPLWPHNVVETGVLKRWTKKKRTMLSAFVITIIITPTDTCCAASLIYPAQHLFITVIVTLGSWTFPTGPDLPGAKEKPALPALLRNVLTFQPKMEYHLMAASDFLLHGMIPRMNTSPLSHSLSVSNVRAFFRHYERTAGWLGFRNRPGSH